VRSVTAEVISQLEALSLGGEVAVGQLLASGRLAVGDVTSHSEEMAARLAQQGGAGSPISLNVVERAPRPGNPLLAVMAPGMALLFLMYTVTQGGRSILAEREMGTLPRMLTTPTSTAEVLGGKVLSIFVIGFLQVGLLVAASSLIFGLRWGSPLAVVLLAAAAALAATGWGILLASLARSPFQVSSIGSALMLLFGLLGGSFIPPQALTPAVRLVSRITPNAWALDGFIQLSSGGGLNESAPILAALAGMGVILFAVSVLAARRRWAAGFMH
jgi:ABC-2 type transport system permease protein